MSTIVHSLRDYRPPTRAQQFAHAFGLPPTEGPYVDEAGNRAEILSAILSLSNPDSNEVREDLVFAGRLTLTPSFLCYASQGDRGRGCRVAIPLATIRRVERLNTRDAVFALSITVWHGMQLVLSLIHISEHTRRRGISYAVFCLKKTTKQNTVRRIA